jgi:hypothetical protein
MPTADYDAGCRVRSTSTNCPTRKSRTEKAARAFAVDAEITEMLTPADFEGAMDAAITRHVEAGILLPSPLVFTSSTQADMARTS